MPPHSISARTRQSGSSISRKSFASPRRSSSGSWAEQSASTARARAVPVSPGSAAGASVGASKYAASAVSKTKPSAGSPAARQARIADFTSCAAFLTFPPKNFSRKARYSSAEEFAEETVASNVPATTEISEKGFSALASKNTLTRSAASQRERSSAGATRAAFSAPPPVGASAVFSGVPSEKSGREPPSDSSAGASFHFSMSFEKSSLLKRR